MYPLSYFLWCVSESMALHPFRSLVFLGFHSLWHRRHIFSSFIYLFIYCMTLSLFFFFGLHSLWHIRHIFYVYFIYSFIVCVTSSSSSLAYTPSDTWDVFSEFIYLFNFVCEFFFFLWPFPPKNTRSSSCDRLWPVILGQSPRVWQSNTDCDR